MMYLSSNVCSEELMRKCSNLIYMGTAATSRICMKTGWYAYIQWPCLIWVQKQDDLLNKQTYNYCNRISI